MVVVLVQSLVKVMEHFTEVEHYGESLGTVGGWWLVKRYDIKTENAL